MPDIGSQMASVVGKLRESHARIRPVSQITVRIKSSNGRTGFASTVDGVLHWMKDRAGRYLPDAAWQRQSFELSDIGSQRVSAIALRESQYWAARLDDADKKVPLRTWITECGVGLDPYGDTILGVRLICATRGVDAPYDRSIPGFVRPILTNADAILDGRRLHPSPAICTTRDQVLEVVALLESSVRQGDVLIFSQPDREHVIPGWELATRNVQYALFGAAHVFVFSREAAFILTGILGKELSVFNGGVRTYRPGFKIISAEPSAHSLAIARSIIGWNDGKGLPDFQRWLINQSLGNTLHGFDREERLPSFDTIRQLSAKQTRATLKTEGASDSELLKLFDEDNTQLRRELEDQKTMYEGILRVAEEERETAIKEANASRAFALERLHTLRAVLARGSNTQAREPSIPDSFDGFESWCQQNLAGAVQLLNRAFNGVKKSNYSSPALIYKALILLKDFYVPMRVEGSVALKKKYDEALKELGLEESPTGDGVKFSPELYSAIYEGRKRDFDKHLKSGNSRDPRFAFRLYFFWDDDSQLVVVGWLPSHLENRLS